MQIGKKIKFYRTSMGITQTQLAEKINLSRKTVSSWETGRSLPDLQSLVSLSNIFDVPLDNLIKDSQIINDYDCQIKKGNKSDKVRLASYIANIIFLVILHLGFIFNFLHITILISEIGITVSVCLFLLNLQPNNEEKNHSLWSTVEIIIALALLNIFLLPTRVHLTSTFNMHEPYYLFGFTFGALIITTLLVISEAIILIGFPRKHLISPFKKS
ncbi:transcriptional regulator [Lentilactobacillus curieae]|uniref:Transcriptional regulator n=1 Tax=Lentilactobacillus curieae TaxID=1138822 RepID=A0A1S6QIN4_9LACO|nr:helix-turn-helix transcriptional regulator [Lentilactobacillus curieae]AQW21475.1 transcriptional regulator [Lentilactobacillus curieae]